MRPATLAALATLLLAAALVLDDGGDGSGRRAAIGMPVLGLLRGKTS